MIASREQFACCSDTGWTLASTPLFSLRKARTHSSGYPGQFLPILWHLLQPGRDSSHCIIISIQRLVNTVNWLTLSFRILHLEHPPLVPWFTILLAKVTLREWWSGHQGRRLFNYHEETNGEGCRDGIRRRRGDVATHALAICLLP